MAANSILSFRLYQWPIWAANDGGEAYGDGLLTVPGTATDAIKAEGLDQ